MREVQVTQQEHTLDHRVPCFTPDGTLMSIYSDGNDRDERSNKHYDNIIIKLVSQLGQIKCKLKAYYCHFAMLVS